MPLHTDLQSESKPFRQPEISLCKGFWYFRFVGVVKQKPKLSPEESECPWFHVSDNYLLFAGDFSP